MGGLPETHSLSIFPYYKEEPSLRAALSMFLNQGVEPLDSFLLVDSLSYFLSSEGKHYVVRY